MDKEVEKKAKEILAQIGGGFTDLRTLCTENVQLNLGIKMIPSYVKDTRLEVVVSFPSKQIRIYIGCIDPTFTIT